MPTLSELPPPKRKEVARLIAQEAFKCIDPSNQDGDAYIDTGLGHRFFAALYASGLAHDKEFYGPLAGFTAARGTLLDEFDKFHSEALEHAKLYDDCIKPVQEAAPNFAVASSALVRMWCTTKYASMLCKEDSPFADLEIAEDVDDEDLDADSESESEEGEEEVSDCDDIIATTSEESSEEEEEEDTREARERKNKRKNRDREGEVMRSMSPHPANANSP